ncbi:hypothetical protein Tco_1507746 [Tanacetum coccineum]
MSNIILPALRVKKKWNVKTSGNENLETIKSYAIIYSTMAGNIKNHIYKEMDLKNERNFVDVEVHHHAIPAILDVEVHHHNDVMFHFQFN